MRNTSGWRPRSVAEQLGDYLAQTPSEYENKTGRQLADGLGISRSLARRGVRAASETMRGSAEAITELDRASGYRHHHTRSSRQLFASQSDGWRATTQWQDRMIKDLVGLNPALATAAADFRSAAANFMAAAQV